MADKQIEDVQSLDLVASFEAVPDQSAHHHRYHQIAATIVAKISYFACM